MVYSVLYFLAVRSILLAQGRAVFSFCERPQIGQHIISKIANAFSLVR